MKAKVIETGEIIDVQCLRPVIYSRLSGGKIVEEYDEDELEFLNESNKPKMISLDKACKYLKNDMIKNNAFVGRLEQTKIIDGIIDNFRKAMEE